MNTEEYDKSTASKIFYNYTSIKNSFALKRINMLLNEVLKSKNSYNPKMDYIHLFEDYNGQYSCYNEFKNELEEFIKEVSGSVKALHIEDKFQKIIDAYNNYSFDMESLKELSVSNKKTLEYNSGIRGLVKRRKNEHIKKEFFSKLYDVTQQLSNLDTIIGSFKESHSNDMDEHFAAVKQRHPELNLKESIGEYNLLKKMEDEKIFETKDYQLLKNNILIHLSKADTIYRTDTPEIIYRLVTKLRIGNNSRIYFLNLKKYIDHYGTQDYGDEIASMLNSFYLNIVLFFDKTLFEIIDSIDIMCAKDPYRTYIKGWVEYITDVSSARGRGRVMLSGWVMHDLRSSIYGSDTYKLRETLFDNDDTIIYNPPPRAVEIRNAMQLLASSKLKLDSSQDMVKKTRMLTDIMSVINLKFAKFLIKIDVRKMYGIDDSAIILNISNICSNPNINYFENDSEMWFYWNNCVYNNLREFYYLEIFLRCYTSQEYGKKFLSEIASKNIKLNSTNLIDIDFDLLSKYKNSKEIQSDILNKQGSRDTRKMVVCTLPGADHNTAFESTLSEVLNLPRDKYELHVMRIKTPSQLAQVLKDISAIRKIDILFINGHGRTDRTDLGGDKGDLMARDLKTHAFDGIKNCFNKDAECYLMSCSTGGGDDPLAKHVSEAFGIKTYAPIVDSSGGIHMKNDELVVEMRSGSSMGDTKKSFYPEDEKKSRDKKE